MTLEDLQELLDNQAPANTSPLPLAASVEVTEDGGRTWTLDVHIREPETTEFDFTVSASTLEEAVRLAISMMGKQPMLRYNSRRANQALGLTG